jgi:DNA-directed RNA polymerase subunit RPC12/RpoP
MARHDPQTAEMVDTQTALTCPYCLEQTVVKPAANYAPVYARCGACGKRFIVERMSDGIRALRIEGAPSCSDPDRRAIEMGAGQED